MTKYQSISPKEYWFHSRFHGCEAPTLIKGSWNLSSSMKSLKNLNFGNNDDFMVLRRFESVDPTEHAKPKAILN